MPHRRDPSLPLWPDASLDDLMALARSRYDVCFEPVSAGGVRIDVLQITNMRELLDKAVAERQLTLDTLPLWAKIWPASVILGHMLRHIPPAGHRLLEIGAGLGVTGLVGAALGFERVVISDINEDALLFARINVLKNGLQGRAEVRRVDILTDGPDTEGEGWNERFTLILGSEILYLEPLYRPLAKFLKRRLTPASSSPAPEAYLASDHRRNAKPFFKRAEKDFAVGHKPVAARQEDGGQNTGTDDGQERGERHLLMIHRLRPLL